jgi:fibronectin type 3 domain-containing protein
LLLCTSNVYSAQATLSWNPNSERDLAGYKVYYGNSSRTYHTNIDVHKVTTYTITDLSEGEIYYFAATAYDKRKNESGYSNEVSYDVPITSLPGDTTPPTVTSVSANSSEQVVVVFSEPVEEASATNVRNYGINNRIKVYGASLGSDQKTVTLTTSSHIEGTYTLTVDDIEDLASSPNVIAVDTSVSYNYVNQLQVTNLNVASGKAYQIVVDGLQNGALVYIDRTYAYSTIPTSLQGATYIKTANDDKASSSASFLTFEVNQDVTVYVAHDDRITTKPSWLVSFTDTGDNLVTTYGTSYTTLSIFASDYLAGTITLGGNEGGGYSMYTVVIVGNGDYAKKRGKPSRY